MLTSGKSLSPAVRDVAGARDFPGEGEPEGIVVHRLSKRFGTTIVFEDVSLRVGAGEIVALLGPNGAGKSTLLRILGTTVLPDSGQARVATCDVVREPERARRLVGMVLGDERSFYGRLTGRENLDFFAALQGGRARAARSRAGHLLVALGLAGDRPYREYSLGMKARLGLARALLGEPKVLLLDEPTSHLDPAAAADFRQLVLRLTCEHGIATLLTTHNLHEAASIATRAAVLVHGRVREPGSRMHTAEGLEEVLRCAEAQSP
jgi:ABC-2 type transport system ATP-binding protein